MSKPLTYLLRRTQEPAIYCRDGRTIGYIASVSYQVSIKIFDGIAISDVPMLDTIVVILKERWLD